MDELNIDLQKWQPVMLVLDKRLDCGQCGSAAVFIIGSVADNESETLEGVQCFCQDCFTNFQKSIDWS